MAYDPRELAQRIARLETQPRAELLRRLAEQGVDVAMLPIVPFPTVDRYPLSYAQQGLWLTWRMDPRSPAYNMAGLLSLEGPLDQPALFQALTDLAERHAVLRTVFIEEQDQPRQLVLPALPAPFMTELAASSFDVSTLRADQREARARDIATELSNRPFELDAAPAWRIGLIRLDEHTHWLSIVIHHILADGWSQDVLLKDLAACYAARSTGALAEAAPLPIQFGDYALWQREWYAASRLPARLAYWKSVLEPIPEMLRLPLDRPRPRHRDGAASTCHFVLAPEVVAGLRRHARDVGASVYMCMLALLKLTLSRYCGQDDIAVGSPVADRTRAETHGLVGYLTNMTVLRTRVDTRHDFHALLAAVRTTVLDAQANQDCPYDLLVSELGVPRSPGVNPLFQVKCTEQASLSAMTDGRLGDLVLRGVPAATEHAHFDLSLDYTVDGGRIECSLIYATDVWDAATMEGFAETLSTYAAMVAADAGQPLHLLMRTGSGAAIAGERAVYADSDVLALWARQVAMHGERIAVRAEDRGISYRDLDGAARRLGDRLAAAGAGPESRVGLHAGRGCEFVVGLLAILKAGAACVPMDPDLPKERLAHLVRDSGACVVLSDAGGADAMGWLGDVPRLGLQAGAAPDTEHGAASGGRPRGQFSAQPDSQPDAQSGSPSGAQGATQPAAPAPVHPAQAAYLIYTSGSTGAPKGVVVSRGALNNYVQGVLARLALPDDADSMAMVSTVGADLGHTVLFGALCAGRTLHMISAARAFDPDGFAAYMAEHRIGVLKIVPGHLQALLQSARAADVLPRHALVLGGEATSWPLYDRIAGLAPACRVFNHYGPTETTVGALTLAVAPYAERLGDTVPVGRPLPNMSVCVLDGNLDPVPPGAEGELYISGPAVARGYRDRPGQTAERFVASLRDPAQRMYRTGDRVRILRDGSIAFLGRVDDQVKVRGYRVEPAEIAAVLKAMEEVDDAAVVPRAEPDGRLQLHAYVTPAGLSAEPAPDVAMLRDRVAARLPDYMVPSTFTVMPALPRTANGKLDRRALPEPRRADAASDNAPVGPVEEALAEIWAEVLGVPRVGRGDNFFELGGDSILSLKVMARARRKNLRIAPRLIFDHQTLRALAAAVAAAGSRDAATPGAGASITPSDDRPAAAATGPGQPPRQPAMSYAQQRQWFLWRMDPNSSAYHVSGAMQLRGMLDLQAVSRGFDTLVARHAGLRTRFVPTADGLALPEVLAAAPVIIRECDLRLAPPDKRDAQARDAARAWVAEPFDLETGPLLRVGLIRLDEQSHVLVLAMHHIVSDGWSMQILVEEFSSLYRAYAQAQTPALRELPGDYAGYAARQRAWLEQGEGRRQLAYWTDRLGGEQPVLHLPVDAPRRGDGVYRADSHGFDVPPRLAQALRQAARAQEATVYVLLLSAFQALLHRYCREADIRVGVPIANRHREGTEAIIGFFVNTQVMRATITPATTLGQLIAQTRDAARQAQAHQDLPFEHLVEALQPDRAVGRTPLFQAMFNHQRPDYGALRALPGLEIADFPIGGQAAQFELTCNTAELPDGRIAVNLVYAGELFEPRTMEQLGRHYLALLEQITQDARVRVARARLNSDSELQRLASWGDRRVLGEESRGTGQAGIHRRFEEAVRRHPRAPALACGDCVLDYSELNARANRLAHRLIAEGVGPEVRVGLAAQRSAGMVVAMLAILKAGGAYVPLDPDYPEERLRYTARDSGMTHLMLQTELASGMAWLKDAMPANARVVEFDAAGMGAADPGATGAVAPDDACARNPDVPIGDANLAYVIYTSGSTGRPKGAQLCHGQVRRLLSATDPWFGFGPHDVWTLFHSYAFDFSVWEIFGALCTGGKLVVVPYAVSRSPDEFLDLLREQRVTVLNQTPSAFQQLMQVPALYRQADGHGLALRVVIFGGEALEPRALLPWMSAFGDRAPRLVNMYGITETTVHVTYRPITLADVDTGSSPIGMAIPDLGLAVLDEEMSPAPIGVPGELHVSGAGLARGYLNRPGLTAERFVAHPDGKGERLYRTGDLARWTQDGQLEYLGRLDQQVKIRGFRIELGEIEAQLLVQPGVKQAAVLAQSAAEGEGKGNARLVAYVTPASLDTAALRQALERVLPAYMVPAAIVALQALPITGNGKLDRKALPQAEFASTQNYEAPQSQAEEALAAIWREVLGAARIGRHDNFFELGGDSILSLQIVARLRQAGWRVSPRQMFERQSIAALAEVAMLEDGASTHSAHQDDAAADRELPLLPIQAQFLAQPLPTHDHWNQAVLLHSDAEIDMAALRSALAAVLAHHDALRLRFHRGDDGQWIQTYADMDAIHGQDIVWDLTARDAAEIEAHCARAQASLDIANGPLLRAVRLRVADGSWRLLLVVHHLAIDGVSWRILLEDLRQAYGQVGVPLPARTAGYGAWARHLRGQASVHAAEAQYWLDQAAGDFPAPDHPDGTARVCDQRHIEVSLTRVQTQSLLRQAPAAYRTQVNDLLLASLASALKQWRGLRTVRIDLEGHGRETGSDDHHPHGIAASAAAPDITRTVGWFTTIYPVVLDTEGGLDQLIPCTKEQLRAIPRSGLGHGLLKLWGEPSIRDALAKAPQAPILFNYLGQFDATVGAGQDWRIAAEDVGSGQLDSAPLSHALTVNGRVYDGRLTLALSFSRAQWRGETMRALADCWTSALSTLIGHCASGARGVTPSDFPLARLTQAELDGLPIPAPVSQWQDIYPVTPMQAGMLFHSIYERDAAMAATTRPYPNQPAAGQPYINQLRVDVRALDPVRFRAAWESAVVRHDVLRTGFIARAGAPLQWVARQVQLPFELQAVRGDADEVAARLDALAAEQRAAGFDLAAPPLMRCLLVRVNDDYDHFIWTHHHLLLDGWSTSQLLGEVLGEYAGKAVTRPGGRYRDYLQWLSTRDMHATRSYWMQQLHELEAPTLLAEAISARAGQADAQREDRYGSWTLELDEEDTQALAAYARRERITLNTLVQAAWSLVLSLHTGQDAVVFGATTSGRPDELPGLQRVPGLYINTLPVVAQLNATQTVGDWLRQLQARNVAAREHEHSPLYEIQRWAGQGGRALFDTLVVFENYPVDEALAQPLPDGLRFSGLTNTEHTGYPFTLIVSQRGKLYLRLSHDALACDAQDAEMLGRRLLQALSRLASDGEAVLGTLGVLAPHEGDALRSWAAGGPLTNALAGWRDQPVHAVIAAQAGRTPDAVAVCMAVDGAGSAGLLTLTYAELERQSNRLAHRLLSLGVGPERRVAIAAYRHPSLVVSLLAVLKTGAAYVPLDPEYPDDRLAYMMRDSAPALLLTQSWLSDRMRAWTGAVLEVDTLDLAGEPDHAPEIPVHAEQACYVIYTSGSTGKPKGATNRHVGLGNRIAWMQQAYGLGSDDVVLQKTPFSFDVSVWEFFWPLMAGARLALAGVGEHRDAERLLSRIVDHGVTTMHFVPSMLHAFVSHCESLGGGAPMLALARQALRRIYCSGEALPAELCVRFHALFSAVELHNLYGPTEAAIDVTSWNCANASGTGVPIGRPIAGLRTHVLDANLNEVPPGVAGELYLGGTGLGRGYLDRPALTADRFIADPFGSGQRLYRTGDLARWNHEGQLEYLGRLDHQIKLRGQRIELGEIEAQLLAQSGVKQAVVLAQSAMTADGAPSDAGAAALRLVAYVTPAQLDTAALRRALEASLPAYMIPSAFVMLDALPVTANGKLDRKALPQAEFASTQRYEAPQGQAEATLAAIWREVLGATRIGRHDNFFELGGDSILSIQIVARARQAGLLITPRQVFEHQTIGELAHAAVATIAGEEAGQPPPQSSTPGANSTIGRKLADHPGAPAPATLGLRDADIEDVHPLSPTQQGMLFHTLEAAGKGLYVNQLSVRVQGADAHRLAGAWAEMVARHPTLRTAFVWQSGMERPLQIVHRHVDPDVRILDWRGRPDLAEQLAACAAAEARAIDPARPPLSRLALIRVDADSHQLIWTHHHLLLDGWSASRLTGEWLLAYGGEPLPPAGPAYGHYVRWLGTQDRDASERFWKQALRSLDGPTLLAHCPGARQQAEAEGYARIYSRLDAARTTALRQFAQAQRVTLNTVIQAAWGLLLQRCAGKETVVFGATVAGRPAALPGVEDILGLFINTIPVPVRAAPSRTVGDFLRDLQAENLRLREHEHAGLADIQRWAGSSGRPLFDSIVVFENYPVDRALKGQERYGLRFEDSQGGGLTGYVMDIQVVATDEIELEYCYSTAHLPDAMVLDLRRQMEHLLREIERDAHAPVGDLGWLDEPALDQLRAWSRDADQPVAGERRYVHHLIAAHARRQPDALAVVMDDDEYSYAALDKAANRLAHRLIQDGIGPEVRVGVAMPRSLDTIVAFLAVLKAGGAYVPMDLDHPEDRLAYIARDSGMALLLASPSGPAQLSRVGVPVLVCDTAAVAGQPAGAPDVRLSPDNLAYIIYTSGSTGKPKGVAVSHGPLAMHCQATARIYGMTPASRELLFMSFSFDGAHERWLTALTTGARLAVRGQELWTAQESLEALHRYGITNAAFPPAYLAQMAEHAALHGNAPPMDLYVFGGEAMPRAVYERVRTHLPARGYINGYGPTETVVTPLIWKAPAGESFDCPYAPIGKTVGERRLYVLDADLRPVPVGHVGELFIGGYGVARGYLGRMALTAESFVADPFGAPGTRMYRSGDMARWLADGNVEYIGRRDNQVKIRGFRIELGEVESRILALPGVEEAAVVVRQGPSGAQLAAYIGTGQDGSGAIPPAARLRTQLAAQLPDYMVPASITVLPRLPRLISGKLDRQALPAPSAAAERDFVAPATNAARQLAAIWEEVLDAPRVGQTDNFFELGGDSLLSLKMLSRVRALAQPDLSFTLRDLMRRPTIAGLLGLEDMQPAAPVPLNACQDQSAPLFCVHAGMGTLYDYQPMARKLDGIRPVYGLPCRMLLDGAHVDRSLAQMADDYCAMVTAAQPQGPVHLFGWSLGGTLAAMMAQRLEAQGRAVAFLGLVDTYVSGLEQDPLRDWREDLPAYAQLMVPDIPADRIAAATAAVRNASRGGRVEGAAAASNGVREFPAAPDSPDAPELTQEAAESRLRELLAGSTAGHAALGAQELARIFLVARRLQALSLEAGPVGKVRVRPWCWWRADRDPVQRWTLSAQLGHAAGARHRTLDADHYAIIRAGDLLAQVAEALASSWDRREAAHTAAETALAEDGPG